jgi:hypothetical protein
MFREYLVWKPQWAQGNTFTCSGGVSTSAPGSLGAPGVADGGAAVDDAGGAGVADRGTTTVINWAAAAHGAEGTHHTHKEVPKCPALARVYDQANHRVCTERECSREGGVSGWYTGKYLWPAAPSTANGCTTCCCDMHRGPSGNGGLLDAAGVAKPPGKIHQYQP